MKASDKTTIELSGSQVAMLYAIVGKTACGNSGGFELFETLENRLGIESGDFASHLMGSDHSHYHLYKDAWEQRYLTPEKTAQELEIEMLESVIRNAQEKIKQLKEA